MTSQEYEKYLDQKKRPFHYCVWNGCNIAIASSIEQFSRLSVARLAKNPHWSPTSALGSIIDASWSKYVRDLKIAFFENQLKGIPELEGTPKLEGLLEIDVRTSSGSDKELLDTICRLNRSGRAFEAKGLAFLTELISESTYNDPALNDLEHETKALAECEWLPAYKELLASLDSIIDFLGLCRQIFRDSALQRRTELDLEIHGDSQKPVRPEWFGDLNLGLLNEHETEMEFDSDELHSPICEFPLGGGLGLCNQPTEFENYRQGDTLDDGTWQALRRFDVRRCSLHRNFLLVPPWWELGAIDLPEANKSLSQDSFAARDSILGKFCESSALRYRQTCRLCPRRSELWACMRSGGKFSTKLSRDFCRHHRPQQQDGSWRRNKKPELERSTYESRVLKVWIYRREFARLKAHVTFGERGLRTSSNLALDRFARMVVARLELYEYEHFELARVAWHLVEHDVNDRKKEIIMRVDSRHSKTAIAKDFGISRQAVHGALKSVPKCFRFDLPTEKQDKHQFVTF